MDRHPGRAGGLAQRTRNLLRALVFVGATGFFTLVGCATIFLLTGQLHPWQLAVSSITGAAGAIGVIAVFGALRPPDRW